MESFVVYAVILCLFAGFQDCLGIPDCMDGGDAGEICQTNHECCNEMTCKKPPHTCNGVCNDFSCSGVGSNRPEGMQCDYDSDCDLSMPCQRPFDKRCNEICPQCVPTGSGSN